MSGLHDSTMILGFIIFFYLWVTRNELGSKNFNKAAKWSRIIGFEGLGATLFPCLLDIVERLPRWSEQINHGVHDLK